MRKVQVYDDKVEASDTKYSGICDGLIPVGSDSNVNGSILL